MDERELPVKPDAPRTWLSKAYLMEIEPKTYGLYRNLMTEEYNSRLAKKQKVKVKSIGPIGVPLREAEKGEEGRVVLKTVHPTTGKELHLVELQ